MAVVRDMRPWRVAKVWPVTVSQYEELVVESQDFDSAQFEVTMGGVLVSQKPVMRTVLINQTSSTLWEVDLLGVNISTWEMQLSAAYWDAMSDVNSLLDVTAASLNGSKTSRRASKSVISAAGPNNGDLGADKRAEWYPYWTGLVAEQTAGAHTTRVFRAADGYNDVYMWRRDGSSEAVNISSAETPKMSAVIARRRGAVPGPLLLRHVLGLVRIVVDGTEHTIVREYAQRYNYSKRGVRVSFAVPGDMELHGGYADVVVRWANGLSSNTKDLVQFSSDCNKVGYFVSPDGSLCLPCPNGAFWSVDPFFTKFLEYFCSERPEIALI